MNTLSLRRAAAMILAAVCLLGVAACSNSRKEDDAYKNAKALPPLEVPPDLINPPKDSSTAVPELPPAAEPPGIPPPLATPPPVETKSDAAAVVKDVEMAAIHIEKQGALRWLVVPVPVEQAQLRVKDFLVQKGYAFAKEAPGTLETEWRRGDEQAAGGDELESALRAGLQDKYKVRIEPGRGAGTSDIYIDHYGLQRATVDGKTGWQPRAADALPAAEMLDQLQAFLVNEGTEPQPVVDLPDVKAQVTTDAQGRATLRIQEGFDQAWHRIGIALGRARFVTEDRDRSQGVYTIRLGSAFKEDRKAGFFGRLFGSNGGDPDEQYRIAVEGDDDRAQAVVRFPGGGPVTTRIGQRILERIKEKMN